ncbi:succinate dehydrogenase cytochrome b subunit [Gemmata sp. G18]|uniref:Succinate dehydrogenase cytochrome b subunit n=1 Tax=Gemmata palustris TaxID=2822762 RepID=A0ABS5C3K0_9BACT|nr:succinate dehydrogenase cytochrome b subunit [Gemmata palustris]MBP3960535.1 succinate dehydrogenase cytochrome b subunit [Gemmata palustris]
MSSTTVRHPKGPPALKSDRQAAPFLRAFFDSSVGAKVTVALTGLGLAGFSVFHMIGNLKVFQGPDAINSYAHFLTHSLGALLWIARAGLLAIFLLHLALAIRLKLRSRAARPIGYAYPGSVQATVSSRTMIWSGAVVGLFVLFHLAHFTLLGLQSVEVEPGKVVNYLELKDKDGRHDVYNMVVAGFTTPWLAVLYIVAQVVLFVHLLHGVQSAFQTLGLKNNRFAPLIRLLGVAIAATILVGNLGIVIGVWAGLAPPLLLYGKAL